MAVYRIHWEIMAIAEAMEKLSINSRAPQALIDRMYRGNGMRFMHTPKPRHWKIDIKTKTRRDDGTVDTHEMTFKSVGKRPFALLMTDVSQRWLDTVDNDLAGHTAISAHATAEFNA